MVIQLHYRNLEYTTSVGWGTIRDVPQICQSAGLTNSGSVAYRRHQPRRSERASKGKGPDSLLGATPTHYSGWGHAGRPRRGTPRLVPGLSRLPAMGGSGRVARAIRHGNTLDLVPEAASLWEGAPPPSFGSRQKDLPEVAGASGRRDGGGTSVGHVVSVIVASRRPVAKRPTTAGLVMA
jgi:hypothetical protein